MNEPRAVDRVLPQRERLRDAHHGFATACDSPGATNAALAAALATLRAAFAEHVEYAEGEGGLFAELRDDLPATAAPELDRLRRDHVVIIATMDRVDRLLGQGVAPDDGRVVEATAELVRLVAQHRRRGAELLYNVYDVEIGAGD
jgi:hypothetical protein